MTQDRHQASKARLRRCHDGKRPFDTLAAAQQAAAAMAARKARQGSGKAIVTYLRAYGCACGRFHIGKTKNINWELVTMLSVPKG